MSDYCKVLSEKRRTLPAGDEARIEKIYVYGEQQEEIRFSWWKDRRFMPRPLDLPESELLPLLLDAIDGGVFSEGFVQSLKKHLK